MRRWAIALSACIVSFFVLYGAARAEASCRFEGGTLYAAGLSTTYPVGLTYDPYPIGIGTGIPVAPDGTFSHQYGWATAYFWVRGHGPSLIKPGPQLNDYHVIAMCEV